MSKLNAIIIGAGHNGLVCASYLAKKGFKVLVLEKNEKRGGLINLSTTLNGLSSKVLKKSIAPCFDKSTRHKLYSPFGYLGHSSISQLLTACHKVRAIRKHNHHN